MPYLRIWILLSAFASTAGWALSGLKALNLAGYGVALPVFLGIVILLRRQVFQDWKQPTRRRLIARFRRPLPALFLLLACLVFVGGLIHPPSNYDALTYRVPRVLYWLQDGHWSWIHTPNMRMNDRSCGFEWLMAPLILFTRSLRGLFLINFIPFLLLPGLLFSVYTRLGISRRVAAAWMWLIPAGYSFLLQAGSIGNDAFAAVYALAAVDLALRAAKSRSFFEAALSLIAVALLGGAKSGNLPLTLPWLIAFLPAVPLLLRRPALSALALLLCAAVSFLPTAILNQYYCGDWTGFVLEPALGTHHPWLGILGNSLVLVVGNLVPPVFPLAQAWNTHFQGWLPEGFGRLLFSSFEPGFHALGEIPVEENAGLGFGLCMLLLVSWATGMFWPPPTTKRTDGSPWQRRLFLAGAAVALLVFFAKSAMSTLPRLVAAYYPVLIPALIASPAQTFLVRKLWWQRLAFALTLLAIPVIVMAPARPLWPANACLSEVPPSAGKIWQRAKDVYATYGRRSEILAPLRTQLPADCKVVGFLGTGDNSPVALWWPLGSRRVEYVLQQDSPEQIRARGIQILIINGEELMVEGDSIEQWLQRCHAEVICSRPITSLVRLGPKPWYLVRLNPS